MELEYAFYADRAEVRRTQPMLSSTPGAKNNCTVKNGLTSKTASGNRRHPSRTPPILALCNVSAGGVGFCLPFPSAAASLHGLLRGPPQSSHERGHILGQFAFKFQLLAGDGMLEPQHRCVQSLPREQS